MSLKQVINNTFEGIAPKLWLSFNILRRNRNFGPDYWLLPELCRKDAISLDIGGNRGWFAYYMSRRSRAVHVFEPNPVCCAELARYKTANMTIHKIALSDRSGLATMRFDPDNTGIGTIENSNSLANNSGIRQVIKINVPTEPLDSFGFSNVGFIKTDVEGHEGAVLRGARTLLATDRPALLVELELRHNRHVFEEVWNVLDPLGYTMRSCTTKGLQSVDRTNIAKLQIGTPESNPDYINNFLFLPDRTLRSI